jgi:hypothetical protein
MAKLAYKAGAKVAMFYCFILGAVGSNLDFFF